MEAPMGLGFRALLSLLTRAIWGVAPQLERTLSPPSKQVSLPGVNITCTGARGGRLLPACRLPQPGPVLWGSLLLMTFLPPFWDLQRLLFLTSCPHRVTLHV